MARRWHYAILMAAALVPLVTTSAFAGPNGGRMAAGAATIQGQGTGNVIVNQSTQSAIINWQTFNIGSGETTRIYMPTSSSTQLDRVTGGQGASQILGTLYSNGKVFLVNPDGILFGMGARINVGSLVATTNDIHDNDFMAGKYNFTIPGHPNASIVNMGAITAQTGGFAALVAPGVRNTGTITARLGTIALASGNGFTLDMYGDNLITLGLTDSISSQVVDVSTGKPLKSLVSNEGELKANGGTVVLTAVAARTIVDSVINNSGVIEANTIGNHNGMIVLGAATGVPNQKVKVSGRLSAAGKSQGTRGGTIQITGENIEVTGATINASGQAGGGTVLIGGDWGGGHPNASLVSGNASAHLESYAVANADTVSIDAATMIDASATGTGNGGKVILWSNQATTFLGTILANGGAQSGDGGFVETSGGTLTFNGTVNTSALNGKTGIWLLDPTDLTIDAAGAATISSGLANNNVVVYTDASGNTSGQGTTSIGPGNIIVGSAISWSSGHTLTLDAFNSIVLNAAISGSNGGLTLSAGNAISALAAVAVGTFTLQSGVWSQVASNLPGFSAKDFRISGGTFLRALGGNGTSVSPYEITDVYGLQGLGSFTASANDYMLTNDINASGTASWNAGSGFSPINDFSGIFDGRNHTISNLTLAGFNASFGGLFGTIASAGVVKDLNVTNASLNANCTSIFSCSTTTGILAGINNGAVLNVTASGTIDFGVASGVIASSAKVGGLVGNNLGEISNSSSNVSIVGSSTIVNIGGLVGSNQGSITQSYSQGSVTGYTLFSGPGAIGGLVGSNTGSISASFSMDTVAAGTASGTIGTGGLVGEMAGTRLGTGGTVTDSYAAGSVTSANSFGTGGLIGDNLGGLVINSASFGKVSGSGAVGGFIGFNNSSFASSVVNSYWDTETSGQNTSAGGVGLTTEQLVSGLPNGFSSSVWGIQVGRSYPYLLWQPVNTIIFPSFNPGQTSQPGNTQLSSSLLLTIDQDLNATATFINSAGHAADLFVSSQSLSLAQRIQRAGDYVQTSKTVNDATTQYLLDWGALASGSQGVQQVSDLLSKITTILSTYTDVKNGELLGATGEMIGLVSQTLLDATFARVGYAFGGSTGANAGGDVAGITGDTLRVAGAIVTSYVLGLLGAPNS